jgi:hypothetical protein
LSASLARSILEATRTSQISSILPGDSTDSELVASESTRAGAGSPVNGASSQDKTSTITGLSLTKDQYLAAVRDGVWSQVQGNAKSATGFSNNRQVAAAAARAQALPSVSTADLQASPDIAAFVASIGPATANAQIGGTDQRYEKFLTFGRNADNEVVVTGISVVGRQGGNIAGLITPDVISIAHVHYDTLVQPPNSGDDSIGKVRNLPSFVIGNTGQNVWEIGRVNGNIAIRSVGTNNTFGQWEKYQSNADNYRIYNGRKY